MLAGVEPRRPVAGELRVRHGPVLELAVVDASGPLERGRRRRVLEAALLGRRRRRQAALGHGAARQVAAARRQLAQVDRRVRRRFVPLALHVRRFVVADALIHRVQIINFGFNFRIRSFRLF